MTKTPMTTHLRSGLTLIEMLVVLTILAVLTTLAITMTEATVDQTRFSATQQQLQGIKDAVIGPAGQPSAPSFVADTGRLPWASPDPVSGLLTINELWANPYALPSFGPCTPSDPTKTTLTLIDPSVTMLSGWRGPYFTLPPGQTQLLDGWGNPFTFLQPTLSTTGALLPVTGAGQWIGQVQSGGGPNTPYDQASMPLGLPLSLPTSVATTSAGVNYWSLLPAAGTFAGTGAWTQSPTISGSVTSSTVNSTTGSLTPFSTDLTVLLFVPDVTKTTGYVRVMAYHLSCTGLTTSPTFTFPVPSTDPNYSQYTTTALGDSLTDAAHTYQLPPGPKVIRIYPYTPSGTYWQPPLSTTGVVSGTTSGIVTLRTPAGGTSGTQLYYP